MDKKNFFKEVKLLGLEINEDDVFFEVSSNRELFLKDESICSLVSSYKSHQTEVVLNPFSPQISKIENFSIKHYFLVDMFKNNVQSIEKIISYKKANNDDVQRVVKESFKVHRTKIDSKEMNQGLGFIRTKIDRESCQAGFFFFKEDFMSEENLLLISDHVENLNSRMHGVYRHILFIGFSGAGKRFKKRREVLLCALMEMKFFFPDEQFSATVNHQNVQSLRMIQDLGIAKYVISVISKKKDAIS